LGLDLDFVDGRDLPSDAEDQLRHIVWRGDTLMIGGTPRWGKRTLVIVVGAAVK
jgi:hypothetical protein